MSIAGPLPGEGSIHGVVSNNCRFPIYVREAIAEFSGVTGKRCKHFGETQDRYIGPGKTYTSRYPTYFDGCGTSSK